MVILLAAALKGETLEKAEEFSPLTLVLRQRVMAFIKQNIHLPEMSQELIQRRFNVSRTHLYRAFAADGGVTKVLRDMRLDAAFVELTRRNRPSAPSHRSQLAWVFQRQSVPARFSRTFRRDTE